ncbi:ABC transporter permease [Martelella soudanensis]|uniref:ABC transporter permease n=1 Tax=unclassified Martelella TaxID=2629616 RepID=UPI0015DECAA2|nr:MULTISPECIES: ABC transporter permease subunit [unclassified Martelella]
MGKHLCVYLSIARVVCFVLIWQVASMTIIDPFFLPQPTVVLSGFIEFLGNGTMVQSVLISIMRILVGWLIGSAVAIPLGLMVGISARGRAIVDPFIHFFRFVPAIALVTLFIVWFGVGEMSKILLIAYATAFIVMVNTASGVGSMPCCCAPR